jgi:hypothetical protein
MALTGSRAGTGTVQFIPFGSMFAASRQRPISEQPCRSFVVSNTTKRVVSALTDKFCQPAYSQRYENDRQAGQKYEIEKLDCDYRQPEHGGQSFKNHLRCATGAAAIVANATHRGAGSIQFYNQQ